MNFYAQNTALSLLVVGCWSLVISCCLQGGANDTLVQQRAALMAQAQEPKPVVKTIPGDERLGVVDRDVYLDADQMKRKEVVRFHDGAEMTINYDSLSRLLKIVETRKDGQYLVFTFDPKRPGGKIKKQELFRADHTLIREIMPSEKDGKQESRYFAADGKTPVCVQQIAKSGAYRVTCFHKDGKTPSVVFSMKSDKISASLKKFDEKGNLRSAQKIAKNAGGCANPLCHECTTTYTDEIKHYREDGETVWFTVTQAVSGDSSPVITEYHADGKTVLRVVREIPSTEGLSLFAIIFGGALNKPAYDVAVHDASGKLVQKRQLRNNFSAITESDVDSAGKSSNTKTYRRGELLDTDVRALLHESRRFDLSSLNPYLVPRPEPDHLRQAIADILQ